MLLVDCYNVLHCSHVLPDRYAMVDPAGLCAMIRRSGLGSSGAVVVCDGVPKPHESADEGGGRVELVYAGPGRDADTLLERLIDRDTSPRQLVVVSNDRRIRRAARRRRGLAVASEDFLRRLARRLAPPSPAAGAAEKPTAPETDAWLRKFGLDHEPPDEQPESEADYWMRVFGFDEAD